MILLRYCFDLFSSAVSFFLFFLFFCITLADFSSDLLPLIFPRSLRSYVRYVPTIVTTYSHRLFVYNMYIIYMYLYIFIILLFRATENLHILTVYYVHRYTHMYISIYTECPKYTVPFIK